MPAAETVRLFVAIELPAAVRDALMTLIADLQRAGVNDGMRWVRPESIHITLKFLGTADTTRVGAIEAALGDALVGAPAFVLQPAGVGSFGGRTRLRVVWAGLAGDIAALNATAARVEAALAPLGFPTERHPFAAHLTLARVRDEATPTTRVHIHAVLASYQAPPMPQFRAETVSLMRSTIARGGAVYGALARLKLG